MMAYLSLWLGVAVSVKGKYGVLMSGCLVECGVLNQRYKIISVLLMFPAYKDHNNALSPSLNKSFIVESNVVVLINESCKFWLLIL